MARDGVPAVGTSIVLSLDGQKVTGKVTAVQTDKVVVRLVILQPAKAYQGVRARSILPDGQEVSFDLGGAAYYSELLIEVPLPIGSRAVSTPRPAALTGQAANLPETAAAIGQATNSVETAAGMGPGPIVAPKDPGLEVARAKPALNKEAAELGPGKDPQQQGEARDTPIAAPVQAAPAKPASERRHYFRFAVDCPVDIVENVGHTREYVREEGRTVNLSGGGMLAEFDKPLPPGTYRFRLQLPEESMVLTGRVIKKGENSGRIAPIEFIDLHEAERSKLIRFIFNMMRTLRQAAQGSRHGEDKPASEVKDEKTKEKGYWRRREKYFKSTKIRYW